MAAKRVSHQLDAITNAKYWDTLFKDRTVNTRGIVGVNAVGTSGEDNADWLFCDNFLQRRAIGEHLAINGTFAHTARNQLIILPAKVKYDNGLVVHASSILFFDSQLISLFCHKQ